MGTWHYVGHDLSSKQKGNLRQKNHIFLLLCMRESEGRVKEESQGLLSAI